jgi:hypothetical protein
MNESEWIHCTNPIPMLELLGSRMSDRQLKQFSVACYRQINPYLTEEAKRVIEALEAEINGDPDPAVFASASAALESEVFDSSRNTLGGIISNYVLVLTEPPALEGAQTAISAVCRVAEWGTGSASDKADTQSAELTDLANKLRDIVGNSLQPLLVQ